MFRGGLIHARQTHSTHGKHSTAQSTSSPTPQHASHLRLVGDVAAQRLEHRAVAAAERVVEHELARLEVGDGERPVRALFCFLCVVFLCVCGAVGV